MTTTISNIDSWIAIYALLALTIPLLSALVSFAIPAKYSWLISLTAPFLLLLSVISSSLLFYHSWNEPAYTTSVEWINTLSLSAGIHINSLTVVMVWIVTFISLIVHLYSTGYMADEPALRRYFGMLGFFTFSMLGIVLADNLFLIFVFWELVGFSSYMLIGHWAESLPAGRAAKKAFIMNRIGDLGFIVGLMILYSQAGTFQLTALENGIAISTQTAVSLCFFFGVIGKSAQFPLLTWLSDAMEGPTPVSALIHAATMVAAGVFLLARIFFLLTPESLEVIAITGIITSLIGSGAALYHFDIKKILAYSTISQLGLMVLAIGVGAKESSILHLLTHAFFKAGLFLGAGAVIHALHLAQHSAHQQWDVQDIRNLGGLRKFMPVTFVTFIICGASLAGIPFFSGFQSKESILAAVISWSGSDFSWRWLIVIASFLISFLTVLYTFRLIWYVFLAPNKSGKISGMNILEVPGVMRISMISMAIGSCWYVVSLSPFSPSGWYHTFNESSLMTVISIVWVILAFTTAYFLFTKRHADQVTSSFGQSMANALYLDSAYRLLLIKPIESLTAITTRVDKYWIDGFIHSIAYGHVIVAHLLSWFDRNVVDGIVHGVSSFANGIGYVSRSFQKGKIQYYIFWASLGLVLLLLFLI